MNTILLLLYALVAGDPELVLPLPEDYQKLYCQFHTHPVCENMPDEDEPEAEAESVPDADANDAGMLT